MTTRAVLIDAGALEILKAAAHSALAWRKAALRGQQSWLTRMEREQRAEENQAIQLAIELAQAALGQAVGYHGPEASEGVEHGGEQARK